MCQLGPRGTHAREGRFDDRRTTPSSLDLEGATEASVESERFRLEAQGLQDLQPWGKDIAHAGENLPVLAGHACRDVLTRPVAHSPQAAPPSAARAYPGCSETMSEHGYFGSKLAMAAASDRRIPSAIRGRKR